MAISYPISIYYYHRQQYKLKLTNLMKFACVVSLNHILGAHGRGADFTTSPPLIEEHSYMAESINKLNKSLYGDDLFLTIYNDVLVASVAGHVTAYYDGIAPQRIDCNARIANTSFNAQFIEHVQIAGKGIMDIPVNFMPNQFADKSETLNLHGEAINSNSIVRVDIIPPIDLPIDFSTLPIVFYYRAGQLTDNENYYKKIGKNFVILGAK